MLYSLVFLSFFLFYGILAKKFNSNFDFRDF